MDETLEVTTRIGCKVDCRKYCPQEVILKKYTGLREMQLATFKRYIKTVPEHVLIIFAGVSEPFQNKECTDMILHAHNKGHRISLFTTLYGLSMEDAGRVLTVPFHNVVIHMPDEYGIAKIPVNEEYLQVLGMFLRRCRHRSFMDMGHTFSTNHSEDAIRGKGMWNKKGRLGCYRFEIPNPYLMPNGDMTFCCMTRGIRDKIGNIDEQPYSEIVKNFYARVEHMATAPDSLCRQCISSRPWWFRKFEKWRDEEVGGKPMIAYLMEKMGRSDKAG